jgi:D-alanyl-D-alanine dipeptidase
MYRVLEKWKLRDENNQNQPTMILQPPDFDPIQYIVAMKYTALFLLLAALGCMTAQDSPLVRLSEVDASIGQDPKYFGSDNFMGRPINGYSAAQVMLTHEAAAALSKAQEAAAGQGLSLLVYDGYRPQRAVDHFVEWGANLADTLNKAAFYPEVPKAELFDRGYIAERSGHSRGSTVDLTLTRNGQPLDMGTPFDFFDELSHTENPAIEGEAMANRMLLKEIMTAAGFSNYVNEWWHYTLVDEPYPDTYFDLPIE